jgi:hypothetical protein
MTALIDSSGTFPPPPTQGSAVLVPITAWADMHRETDLTKVEFELFWYEKVNEGVAYFFQWLAEPRSTVLVVWNDDGPTHVECRTIGDTLLSDEASAPILAEMTSAFRQAGYGRRMDDH